MHQSYVDPLFELEAHRAEDANVFESMGGVERYGHRILSSDGSHHLLRARALTGFYQRREELTTDSATGVGRIDVDRVFNSEAIGRTRAEMVRVGIADDAMVSFRYEVWQTELMDSSDAATDLRFVRRVEARTPLCSCGSK